jgi:hypothetical protein
LGGLAVLAWRAAAAWRGRDPAPALVPFRMIAVLGALGGFVTYLRDLPAPDAPLGLALGGASAVPWVAVVLLEGIRRLAARRRPAGRE